MDGLLVYLLYVCVRRICSLGLGKSNQQNGFVASVTESVSEKRADCVYRDPTLSQLESRVRELTEERDELRERNAVLSCNLATTQKERDELRSELDAGALGRWLFVALILFCLFLCWTVSRMEDANSDPNPQPPDSWVVTSADAGHADAFDLPIAGTAPHPFPSMLAASPDTLTGSWQRALTIRRPRLCSLGRPLLRPLRYGRMTTLTLQTGFVRHDYVFLHPMQY